MLLTTKRGPSGPLTAISHVFYDTINYLQGRRSIALAAAGDVLTAITGGLHALAWNIHFPTLLECWLWRGCSVRMGIAAISVGLIGS